MGTGRTYPPVQLARAKFTGLGHVVKPMPRVLGQFVLNQNMLVHNEKLLNKRLIHENPTFIV